MEKSSAINYSNPFVFTYKTPFMQRIADIVRAGHTQYIMGTIPLSKAGFLAHKFENQFHTWRSKLQACRAKKDGEANARLLFLHQAGDDHLTWVLLFQLGTKPDQSGQKWRNAFTDKIVITGYELVRHTRKGSKKPAWTWRYTQKQYDLIRESIVQAIRNKQDMDLRQLIQSISRSPGFALVRQQVKKLNDLIQSEWKRRRAKNDPMPELPHHGYTRRLENRGCRLSELISSLSEKSARPPVKANRATPVLRERTPDTGNHTAAD